MTKRAELYALINAMDGEQLRKVARLTLMIAEEKGSSEDGKETIDR